MPDKVPWNVDDDNQYNSDGSRWMVDEMNHQHPILVAEKIQKNRIRFQIKFSS